MNVQSLQGNRALAEGHALCGDTKAQDVKQERKGGEDLSSLRDPATQGPWFEILKPLETNKGRLGRIHTAHGVLETPAFLFCATKGALKGLTIPQVKASGTPILLGNTYHLLVYPGGERIRQFGGLHKMMGWDGPMFTDSGGYQIFSLGHGSVASEIKGIRNQVRGGKKVKIFEEGALFYSYRNGKPLMLTPELSMRTQADIGADLVCVLDECTPYHVSKRYTEKSMELSHRWALRSLEAFQQGKRSYQGLYGIVQGGVYPDLREQSTNFLNAQEGFFGQAIGGSLGANKAQMREVVAGTVPMLRSDRPIHLLGIGGLVDIVHGVQQGIDTFDCVHPTRLGRHGGALVRPAYWDEYRREHPAHPENPKEHINLWAARFAQDTRPIDEDCPCSTCQLYSRGYLHYLLKAKEMTVLSALTVHNMAFMNRFMAALRQGVAMENLEAVAKAWVQPINASDELF